MTTYTITEQQMHRILDAIDFVCREGDRELPETTLVDVLTMLSNLQPNTQKPCAWRSEKPDEDGEIIFATGVSSTMGWRPLYDHPAPQTEPLTEVLDELENCMDLLNLAFPSAPVDSCIGAAITKARAVLTAHGVKP